MYTKNVKLPSNSLHKGSSCRKAWEQDRDNKIQENDLNTEMWSKRLLYFYCMTYLIIIITYRTDVGQ